jgi:hypothetical protein
MIVDQGDVTISTRWHVLQNIVTFTQRWIFMKSFSERKGIVSPSETFQVSSMNEELRNSIWNVFDLNVWGSERFMWANHGVPGINAFSRALWFDFYKKPMDTRPETSSEILAQIRKKFFASTWNQIYDFIEYVVQTFPRSYPRLEKHLNEVLDRELAGYRIISGFVVDVTNEQEVQLLEDALSDGRFSGVTAHLQRALELLADRENPDYRNSIKESVSAIESIARIVAENPKATLPDALKALERNGRLHTALKDGFMKLYAYTSDEQGIRHAMLEVPELTPADAKFFLLSCTSFVQYLKAQLSA